MIKKVIKYEIKGKKYINTPFKIYFEDLGLRNSRLNFRQVEYKHIMENIIYNELRYRGYNVDVGIVESIKNTKEFGRVRRNYEIDFIASFRSKNIIFSQRLKSIVKAKKNKKLSLLKKLRIHLKKLLLFLDM